MDVTESTDEKSADSKSEDPDSASTSSVNLFGTGEQYAGILQKDDKSCLSISKDTLFKESLLSEVDIRMKKPSPFTNIADPQSFGTNVLSIPKPTGLLESYPGAESIPVIAPVVAPLVQKRGPGRPRKDGSGPVQRKKPPSATGRQRGRRKHHFHHPHHPLYHGSGERHYLSGYPGVMGGLPYSTVQSAKIGEPAVVLLSEGKEGKIEQVDSDASLSSALSLDRPFSEESSQEQWPGKTCSFCNLGERSLLGQGDLTKFEPSAGFNPFKRVVKVRRNSSESDQGSQLDRSPKITVWRRQRGGGKSGKNSRRSIQGLLDEDLKLSPPPVDELSILGFSEEPEPAQLFEPSGHTYAHHCCAAWSDGVCQTEEYVLVNVDKAVADGISQKCSYCNKYGATIICKIPKCNKIYHYPCAASSGSFQDIKSLTLLCPQHLNQAPALAPTESRCIVCDSPGEINELLFCTSCGHHYHGSCLDPPVAANPAVRAGWQCPDCKICQTCRRRQPGDDNKMLMCDTCDKGYHTFCLKPAMTTIPKHGWKCKNCRVCTDCGAHTPGSGPSSRWHRNYTVCDSCYQQRNKGLACPLCGRAYRHFTQKDMVQCIICGKYIHAKCDTEIDLATIQQQREAELDPEYTCPLCVPRKPKEEGAMVPGKEEGVSADSSVLVISQDYTLSANEDSVCSMDIDLQAIERSAQQFQQLSSGGHFGFLDDYSPLGGKPVGFMTPKPLYSIGKIGRKRMGVGRPRGSTKFVGIRRRVKTAEFGKRRGPKPKLKHHLLGPGAPYQSLQGFEQSQNKTDEEPGMENKIVLCSSKDEFILSQDLCVMCGSLGQKEEGRLIACSQCGQCYHPYCVTIKVTKVVLSKGWRCLDCTACEGCGQPHDEGRLLLCDDCDISYHIYCLDPPLEQVPQGNWKCRWCVVCVQCGATNPGYGSHWQNNYTQCGPCASQITCPVCCTDYIDDDLIIQCIQCDRWLHAGCDQINSEEDAEKAADYGYHCIICRPRDQLPPHLIPPMPPPEPPRAPTPVVKSLPETPPKSQAQFFLDGVCLSESGMHQIKSLTIEQPKKTRMRKPKLQPMLKMDEGKLDIIHSEDPDESKIITPDLPLDQSNELEKMDIAEEEQQKDISKPDDMPCEKKKRQRNLQKLGVGGFIARSRIRSSISKDLEKNSEDQIMEPLLGTVEGLSLPGSNSDVVIGPAEKPKRRRRVKKKSQLEDSYPSYLQEAFFGRDLLHTSKEQDINLDNLSDEDEISSAYMPVTQDKTVILQEDKKSMGNDIDETTADTNRDTPSKVGDDEDLGDSDALKDILPLPQDLPQDDDLVNILMNEEDALSKNNDDTGLEDITDGETPSNTDVPTSKDDPLTDILGSHFNLDTMVSDTGLPQINSKEVEDLIKGVFPEETPLESPDTAIPGNLQHPAQQNIPSLSPFSIPPPSPYPSEYNSPQFSPGFSEPPSPWPQQDAELESPSHNQRNLLKWEGDEALGTQATISAVLYANINHPDLKKDYPNWLERVKQISKIWRSLPSETRQPYLQKARENRAASRVQKAQQIKDNKPQAKSPKPPIPPIPPISPIQNEANPLSPRRPPLPEKEQDKVLREQKSQREQEQERQWKQLQAMRQQQQQQQQQVLQEHRAQANTNQPPTSHTFAAMARVQQQVHSSAPGVPEADSGNQGQDTVQIAPSQPDQFPRISASQHVPSSRPMELYARSPGVTHPALIQDAVGQPRPALPSQLQVSTSQVSSHSQQSAGIRVPGTFAPPIQVSRVRPPIDPTQMQAVSRGQNEPFCQSPNTSRSIQENFSRMTGSPRSLSPQITRPALRPQDIYNRPPFTPRPSQLQDPYASQPPTPKPATSDTFAQSSPLSRTPDSFQNSPQTPHPSTPELYSQPVPTPRTQNQDPYSQQPATPRPQSQDPYSQSPSAPRPSLSPFSPSQAPRSANDPYAKSPSSTRSQDPYPQSPSTPRQILPPQVQQQQPPQQQSPSPQDSFNKTPLNARSVQQNESCVQSSNRLTQEQFVGTVRARTGADPFSHSGAPTRALDVIQTTATSETFSPPSASRVTASSIPDPYAQQPATPRPIQSSVGEQFSSGQENLGIQEQLLRSRVNPVDNDRTTLMARQHLRDLLQRQQLHRQQKQMEQQIREQQGHMPLRHWPAGQGSELQDASSPLNVLQQSAAPQAVAQSPTSQHPTQDIMRPPMQPSIRPGIPVGVSRGVIDTGFRQPYPPGVRPRIPTQGAMLQCQSVAGSQSRPSVLNSPPGPQPQIPRQMQANIAGQQIAGIRPGQFRHPGHLLDPRLQNLAANDPRLRMTLMQQRIIQSGQLRAVGSRFAGSNPLDPYDHLVQQQRPQTSQVRMPQMVESAMRFGQPQLGQAPLSQSAAGMLVGPRMQSPQLHSSLDAISLSLPTGSPQISGQLPQQQQQQQNSLSGQTSLLSVTQGTMPEAQSRLLASSVNTSTTSGMTSSLPDCELENDDVSSNAVSEELVKLDKLESHDQDEVKDCEQEPDEDLDDDELLGLGNDFNILEYADPELCKDVVGDGKKTNILDENLDLDDKDEDLEEEDDEKAKRETSGKESQLKAEIVEESTNNLNVESKDEEISKKAMASANLNLGPSDFQAKFLEFSQRREMEKAEGLKENDIFEDESLDSSVSSKLEETESKQASELSLDPSVVSTVHPNQNIPSGYMQPASGSGVMNRAGPVQNVFSVQDSASKVASQAVLSGPRPISGQFGQPPVSLPQNVSQQISIPPQPPPYPGTSVPPPPPYSSPTIRPSTPQNGFQGQPVVATNQLGPNTSSVGIRSGLQQQRSLLLQEQPHLLEDLLEQEKEEQRRQQQGLISQQPDDTLLSEIDFEKLKADVLGTAGPPVSMSPGPALPAQGMLPVVSPVAGPGIGPQALASNIRLPVNRPEWPNHDNIPVGSFQQSGPPRPRMPGSQGPVPTMMPVQRPPSQDPPVHPAMLNSPRAAFVNIPPPPTPPAEPVTDAERQQQVQYEQWLFHTKQSLEIQQKLLETEVGKLRKAKKSLNTKQRQLRKNGQELNDGDAIELERITREQSVLQKQLDQIRKQSRQHSVKIQDFQVKQQKRQQQLASQQQLNHPAMMTMQPSPLGPVPSPMMAVC